MLHVSLCLVLSNGFVKLLVLNTKVPARGKLQLVTYSDYDSKYERLMTIMLFVTTFYLTIA